MTDSTFPYCVTWIGKPYVSIGNGQVTTAHMRMTRTEAEARKIAVELSKDKSNSCITVWLEVEHLRWDIDYTTETKLQEDIF